MSVLALYNTGCLQAGLLPHAANKLSGAPVLPPWLVLAPAWSHAPSLLMAAVMVEVFEGVLQGPFLLLWRNGQWGKEVALLYKGVEAARLNVPQFLEQALKNKGSTAHHG